MHMRCVIYNQNAYRLTMVIKTAKWRKTAINHIWRFIRLYWINNQINGSFCVWIHDLCQYDLFFKNHCNFLLLLKDYGKLASKTIFFIKLKKENQILFGVNIVVAVTKTSVKHSLCIGMNILEKEPLSTDAVSRYVFHRYILDTATKRTDCSEKNLLFTLRQIREEAKCL